MVAKETRPSSVPWRRAGSGQGGGRGPGAGRPGRRDVAPLPRARAGRWERLRGGAPRAP